MEVLVISAVFCAIVLAGIGVATTLVMRAILADERYVKIVESEPPVAATPEPAWVRGP